MKLQAFQPVLAYDLALCYYQLGDRSKALEYIGKAKAGTADPKQNRSSCNLVTFFTTGENGTSANDNDKSRITPGEPALAKASAWRRRWKTKKEPRIRSFRMMLLPPSHRERKRYCSPSQKSPPNTE